MHFTYFVLWFSLDSCKIIGWTCIITWRLKSIDELLTEFIGTQKLFVCKSMYFWLISVWQEVLNWWTGGKNQEASKWVRTVCWKKPNWPNELQFYISESVKCTEVTNPNSLKDEHLFMLVVGDSDHLQKVLRPGFCTYLYSLIRITKCMYTWLYILTVQVFIFKLGIQN